MGTFLTTELFIYKANKIHENKYNYSNVQYNNSKIKIKIICPKHGEFEQRPNNHIQGKGCILCAGTKKQTTSDFIIQAKKIHGDKFDYSLVNYINIKTKVKIICKNHGVFIQIPGDHINGFGCSKCGKVAKLNTDEFINRAIEKHGKVYDYSNVKYDGMHKKINIICKKHGTFMQTPHNHLKMAGCPKCNKSKGEKIISWFLNKNNIPHKEQMKFENCKKKSILPFDFYLPEHNMCIEFNGIQHYEPIKNMGGKIDFKKRLENDDIKSVFCKKNKIKLLTIKYDEKIVSILKKELNIK